MDKTSKAHIWATLSAVNIKPHCTESETISGEKFPAVSWMNAHVLMMENFPEYTWEFTEDPESREVHYFNDGTCEVRCRMTILGHTQITSYMVRDGGDVVRNPNSFQINTAKQRCRVKAMAEFGLGHQLWLKKPTVEEPEVVEEVTDQSYEDVLPTDDTEADSKVRNSIDRLWITSLEEIQKARTKTAGQKMFDRYVKALKSRGLEDYRLDRWEEVCSKKGWSA